MKKLAFTILILMPTFTFANCVGSESYKTCYEENGNTYDISRSGNSTTVYGSNSNTGSTWSQQSYKSGNTTSTYGTSADGNSWNSTTTTNGGNTTTYGTDSDGNSFYQVCDSTGNCY